MFCAYCGGENAGNSNFCRNCGHSLDASRPPSQTIRVADLPDVGKDRLSAALKSTSPDTLVIKESKLGWALVGSIGSIIGLVYVVSQANGYKWQSQDLATNLTLVILCFVVGRTSLSYLAQWFRSDFKACVLLNPLYFLRFRFNEVEAVSLNSTASWDAKHHTDSKGNYAGTRFYFKAEGKQHVLKTKSIREANEIILALKRFPEIVSSLIQHQNSAALYSLDLLYEWRRREEAYPRAAIRPPTGLKYVVARLGPIMAAGAIGAIMFFLLIVPFNDRSDDDLRWRTAASTGTASGYRLYVASRPDGRHVSQSHDGLNALYDRAAVNYKSAAGLAAPEGIEAIIKILDYAKLTGRYKVIVNFSGDNEIPDDIDARLRSKSGLSGLVPVLPSFTTEMNRNRESRILERISASFGKIIPGDVLDFEIGPANARDPLFKVNYVISTSGDLYYPVKQEHLPEANRDWYTGVSFKWKFNVIVPGVNASTFQFSLDSEPAGEFNVMSQAGESDGAKLSSVSVYSAMADSAFQNFGSKLIAQLSGN
jgi:hypothetical protein